MPSFAIASRDLRSYLNSPRAGLVFTIFVGFLGLIFANLVARYNMAVMQASQGMGGEAPDINEFVRALFMNAQFILLFIIPGLTMGSFADEYKTQTIKLLQTSPVRSAEIVIGKFLALASLAFFMLVATLPFIVFLDLHGSPDVPMVATAYLGVYLMMLSQISLGMFISSVVSNQFFAFLLTIFTLFLLMIINFFAPGETANSWAGGFVNYIATATHLENFLKGLVTVKSLVYFIGTAIFFSLCSHLTFDSHRWR